MELYTSHGAIISTAMLLVSDSILGKLYTYTPDGIRSSKTVNGTKTEYLLNGTQILAQKTGSDVMWFFYDSTGTRIGVQQGNVTAYYMYNLQGDVVGLADAATGKIIAKYLYDAWGKCVSVENADGYTIGTANPFRYCGYYYDNDTGLYYLQSRYYDPEVGRFINADVFASTDTKDLLGTNMFAYCENNPINNHDSNGDFCIASAIVGGVLNAGLAVAGAYIDSFISGESVKGSDLAVDVIVAFASGFIQGGFSVKWISDAVDIFNMGYTFVNTIEKGGTLEEAAIRTSITYVSTKAGTAVGNQFADDAVDGVSSAIAGAFTQGVINGIEDTGDFLVSAVNSRHGRTSSTRPQKTTTHEVRIHALCAS